MIELVVIFCLAQDPKDCVVQHLPMESPLPMTCMIAGQQHAAAYIWEHPQYRLLRWRCEVNVPRQVPA